MKEEDKEYNKLKFTFTTTYIILLTTASITFIEAIRTPNINVRHVLNLETAISLMAGYFYSVFLEKITTSEQTKIPLKWSDITLLRYTDWLMTTPLMLLVLSMVLSNNVKKNIPLSLLLSIVALDYAMLYAGYLGEIGKIDRWKACGIGFIAFFGMFGLIYKNFVMPVYNLSNYILFCIYVVVWSLYGVFYMMSEIPKNMGLNVLDCIAKCFVGIGLWAYFSKIFVLK
jgi:bacteriorhodopsin